MKTLVNKTNPAIKIIADTLLSDSFNYITGFCSVPKSDWTLVEEEPVDLSEKRKKECPFRKANGCERYANVISECTGACSWVVDYPKLKEIQDKKEQEQPEVDLEKEIKNKRRTMLLDVFGLMNGEQCLAIKKFARHFYELGLNARKEK